VLDAGYWIGLLLAIPAAGFLVRLFMIQHDCGHGSFFRHRLANDWVGRSIGVLTLTPYGPTHYIMRARATSIAAALGTLTRSPCTSFKCELASASSSIAFTGTRS